MSGTSRDLGHLGLQRCGHLRTRDLSEYLHHGRARRRGNPLARRAPAPADAAAAAAAAARQKFARGGDPDYAMAPRQ